MLQRTSSAVRENHVFTMEVRGAPRAVHGFVRKHETEETKAIKRRSDDQQRTRVTCACPDNNTFVLQEIAVWARTQEWVILWKIGDEEPSIPLDKLGDVQAHLEEHVSRCYHEDARVLTTAAEVAV